MRWYDLYGLYGIGSVSSFCVVLLGSVPSCRMVSSGGESVDVAMGCDALALALASRFLHASTSLQRAPDQ